ncbi:L-dopachrome tautomerase-related protein [Cohnella nanjingensis]|nr:L-dopachrome tautomerase-related protein [Cohnella nanjingensis]
MVSAFASGVAEAAPRLVHSSIIGGTDQAGGFLLQPRGIAIDAATNAVYVADTHSQRVQKFDANGAFISTLGTPHPDTPGFTNDLLDVAVDTNGRVLFTTIDNIAEVYNADFSHVGRIGRYRPYLLYGGFPTWTSSAQPYGFTTGYSQTSAGIFQRTDWDRTGDGFSLGMNPTTPGSYVEAVTGTTEIRVGVSYTASVYAVSDYPDKSKLVFYLNYQDASGNNLSSTFIDGVTAGVTSSGWTKLSVSATAPANAVKAKLYIRSFATTYGTVAWDEVSLNESNWNSKINSSNTNMFNYPHSITADPSNNIYVADTYNHQILKFDSNRVYQGAIGSYGTGNGQFANPMDMTIDGSGKKYIADYSNNRIQILNADNSFNTKFGAGGTANEQFNGPYGVAVDTVHSRIYVVDSGNHRIQAFDLSGNFQWGMGSGTQWFAGASAPAPVSGSGSKYFTNPVGIAVNPTLNKLYVTDTGNDRVYMIDLSTYSTTTFGSRRQVVNGKLLRSAGLDIDASGNLYAMDIFNSTVQVFDPSGAYLRKIGGFGSGQGQLNYPNGITLDSTGRVNVVDSFNSRVTIFNNDGTSPSTGWSFGSYGSGNGQFDNPMYMAIDTNGRYLVAEWNNNRVSIFNADKTFYGTIPVGQASGIAVNRHDGKIYVASSSKNKIYVYNPDYTYNSSFGQFGEGPGMLFAPLDVKFDDNGFLYVADYRNDRVDVFDLNYDYITSFGTFGTGNNNLSYPDALAIRGDAIYVAEWCNDRVHKLQWIPSATVDNAGFENWGNGVRPTYWTLGYSNIAYGTGITRRTDIVHGGSSALNMTASPAGSYVEATQVLSVTAGTSYNPKAWVKSNAADNTRVKMHLQFLDANNEVIATPSTDGSAAGVNNSTWTQMEIAAVAPAGAVKAKLYLRHMGGDNAYSVWDDVSW